MSILFVLALSVINGTTVQASRVVLTLYALEIGAQPLTVGVLAATYSLFPMLFSVTAGRLADRFGSRWLLMFATTAGGFGMLLPFFFAGLPTIFAAGVIIGMSTSVYAVSLQNLVGLLSKTHNRARNFSNYSLSNSAAGLMGPLLAGFSIQHSGHAYACLYLVLLSLVPVTMLAVRRGALRGGAPRATHKGGGVQAMLSEPGVRKVLATGSLHNASDSLYQFYIPVYAHSIGLPASVIGIILAMNAVAAFVVRLILPRLIARLKEEKLLAYAFYAGAASIMLVPFFESAVMLALISFVFGLGLGCCGPVVTMLMFGNAPTGRSGEALGLKVTFNHLTKVVSPIVFGSVASAVGLPPIFWINALMLGTGGILSWPRAKS